MTVKYDKMRKGDTVRFLSKDQTDFGPGEGTIVLLNSSFVHIDMAGNLLVIRRNSLRLEKVERRADDHLWIME